MKRPNATAASVHHFLFSSAKSLAFIAQLPSVQNPTVVDAKLVRVTLAATNHAARTASRCVYPPAVHAGRLRGLTLALFAAAAVSAVVARKRDAGWATALAFACFALGVVAYGAWRRRAAR